MSLDSWFNKMYTRLVHSWAEERDREREKVFLGMIKAVLDEAKIEGIEINVDDFILDALEEMENK